MISMNTMIDQQYEKATRPLERKAMRRVGGEGDELEARRDGSHLQGEKDGVTVRRRRPALW